MSLKKPFAYAVAFAGLLCAALTQSPSAAQQSAANPVAASDVAGIDFAYEDPARAFHIIQPADWDAKKDYLGYAVYMEPKVKIAPTNDNPVVADPNLTVAVTRRPNPVYIDKNGLEEYSNEIAAKFKETNRSGEDFQIFSKTFLETLPGGKKGFLYYITYKKNGFDVMSAILVRATGNLLYRVTFTDYKVGFDKNLEKYFPVMASLTFEGEPAERENELLNWLPLAGLAAAVFSVFAALRWVSGRSVRNAISGADGSLDDDGPDTKSTSDSVVFAPVSKPKSDGYFPTSEVSEFENESSVAQTPVPVKKKKEAAIPSLPKAAPSQAFQSEPASRKSDASEFPEFPDFEDADSSENGQPKSKVG